MLSIFFIDVQKYPKIKWCWDIIKRECGCFNPHHFEDDFYDNGLDISEMCLSGFLSINIIKYSRPDVYKKLIKANDKIKFMEMSLGDVIKSRMLHMLTKEDVERFEHDFNVSQMINISIDNHKTLMNECLEEMMMIYYGRSLVGLIKHGHISMDICSDDLIEHNGAYMCARCGKYMISKNSIKCDHCDQTVIHDSCPKIRDDYCFGLVCFRCGRQID